jgi:hypothetical protein
MGSGRNMQRAAMDLGAHTAGAVDLEGIGTPAIGCGMNSPTKPIACLRQHRVARFALTPLACASRCTFRPDPVGMRRPDPVGMRPKLNLGRCPLSSPRRALRVPLLARRFPSGLRCLCQLSPLPRVFFPVGSFSHT